MHSSKKVRQCRYYRNGIHCPFDELGCKFGHTGNNESEDTVSKMEDKTKLSNKTSGNMYNARDFHSGHFEENVDTRSFRTSTPKKSDSVFSTSYLKWQKEVFKCETCKNTS